MATSKMPSVLLIVSYTCAFLPLTRIPLTFLTVGVRMTTAFVDFNGNQGIDFKMVPREGFGWMNGTSALIFLSSSLDHTLLTYFAAAYQVGLSFLTNHMRRAVAACTSPEVFFGRIMMGEHTAAPPSSVANDPLGLAMENLTISPTLSGLGSATPPPSYSLP